jgi:uncharacterized protein YdhG (YjbR/CyaY superfamily)
MRDSPRSGPKPKTIDDYLGRLSADKRRALQKVRETVHSTVPNAEECISYSIPAFRLDGRIIFYFGAGADHCAIYAVAKELEPELADFETSGKGTVRFTPEHPIPASLVRKIVKTRVAQNAARRSARKARKSKAR